jgi:hypothetical protein
MSGHVNHALPPEALSLSHFRRTPTPPHPPTHPPTRNAHMHDTTEATPPEAAESCNHHHHSDGRSHRGSAVSAPWQPLTRRCCVRLVHAQR